MPLPLHAPRPLSTIQWMVAIAAGKGGVGKSTVAVNLAYALKQLGLRVGVMDTDIYGPSIRHMLPENDLPRQEGNVLIPAICNGIKMISMAYFTKENEAVAVRAPIANGLISQFIHKVAWGELDVLLIDFPPGTGDIQLTLSQQAKIAGAVMVTTPQDVAILDVRKAMHLFHQVQVPILGIIENMSYYLSASSAQPIYLFGKGGGERFSQETGVPLLGEIPIDEQLCRSGDEGKSLWHEKSNLAIQAFYKIAHEVVARLDKLQNQSLPLKFSKIDTSSLFIKWDDKCEKKISFCEIQKNCGCAHCVDEITGQRLVDVSHIRSDVTATQIKQVGRYGLQFQFSSGCSAGIYSFEKLKSLGSL